MATPNRALNLPMTIRCKIRRITLSQPISSCMIGDDSVEMVACIGGNLKSLNLNGTRVSSVGVGILAGRVPTLEILSLSQTPIDDAAISYISMMPSLRVVDLSNTNIKGINYLMYLLMYKFMFCNICSA